MNQPTVDSRPYAGVSSEERRARRRAQLLEAGLELFGTRGYQASSIREICLHAGLNRRYFYESFSTREDLLRAIYDQIVTDLAVALGTAVTPADGIEGKIRAGIDAFWRSVTVDHRRARILTIEIIGVSEEMESRRREARHGFAEFVGQQVMALAEAQGRTTKIDTTLTARALVAATIDLVIDWMRGGDTYEIADLREHSIQLYIAVAEAIFYDPADPTRRVFSDASVGPAGPTAAPEG